MSEPPAPGPDWDAWWQQASELERVQVAAAINWLKLKWGEESPDCPYCKTNSWTVGTPIYLDVGFGLAQPGFSTLSPLFPVMCTNCGNTVFINAVLGGIASDQVELPPMPEETEEPEEPEESSRWRLPDPGLEEDEPPWKLR